MHVCKDCGGPVEVTRNPPRFALPRYHVVCAKTGDERDTNAVPLPTRNADQPV